MTPTKIDFIIESCFHNPQDTALFERFYDALHPYLTVILVSLYPGDENIVQEALQSAFSRFSEIFRTGKKHFPVSSYQAYFVAIAKNCLIENIRKRIGWIRIDEIFNLYLPPSQFYGEQRAALASTFLLCMMHLERRCQFVLEQYYIRGMNQEELSQRLRIPTTFLPQSIVECQTELIDYFHTICKRGIILRNF